MILKTCPSTLKTGFTTYCPSARKKVFFGKAVSHILPFLPPEQDEQVNALFLENRARISLSGVQKKLSLTLRKNHLSLADADMFGLYILKPIPDD